MRIHLATHGFQAGQALLDHTLRRVSAALSHFADQVVRVVVRVEDTNGPRGGLDKCCSITLQVPHLSPVVVAAVSPDYYDAVDRAARRAGRAARRAFERRWT